MSSDDPRHPWSRLVTAARQVGDERSEEAPYGFAGRITALACSPEMRGSSLFERFALRAVGIAGLLALLSMMVNYPFVQRGVAATVDDEMLVTDDGLAIVMELAGD